MDLDHQNNKLKYPQTVSLLIVALVVFTVLHLMRNDSRSPVHLLHPREGQGCDLFSGRWIYDHDNALSPSSFYKEKQCSFMENSFACQRNGRKDLRFRNGRWQPHQCDLPRFNGKAFLEKIRGKKVLFVGDSINRNQWVSLLCLIEPSLPPSSNKSLTLIGNLKYFQNIEYNVTIGFYWSPFLVESNCDHYSLHFGINSRVVRIEGIEKHAAHWNDADILIFDSHTWWLTDMNITLLWGSFGSPDATNKTVNTKVPIYEMALGTWSDWLEINLNRTRTKLFFMGATPYFSTRGTLGYCYYKNEPMSEVRLVDSNETVMGEEFEFRALDEDYEWRMMDQVLESAIEKLRKRGIQIEYLGVTNMSLPRIDAHPSIFGSHGVSHPELVKRDPMRYSDCIHWCLPGVPDVWNQILYTYIMKKS